MKNYYMCIYIYVIHSNTSLIRTIYYFCSYPPQKKKHILMFQKNAPRSSPYPRLPNNPPLFPPLILSNRLSSMGLRSCDVRSRSTLLACLDSWSTGCVEAISCLAAWALVGFFAVDFWRCFANLSPPVSGGQVVLFGEQEEFLPKFGESLGFLGVQVEMLGCLASRRHLQETGVLQEHIFPESTQEMLW